mgnify:FL=1
MNIIGEGFPEKIDKQIEIRQSKYGSKSRSNEVLAYLNSKTGWVRMGSSVDVEVDSRGLNLMGPELAKQYVLFNGTSAFTSGEIPDQKSGISRDNELHTSAAYGIGGNTQGIVPMPGITQTSIKTETRGLLKTATIGIKCFNQTQFDIIDTLYMRLGYTILLEWGHSSYFDNNDDYIGDNIYNLMDNFLGIGKKFSYSQYYEQINKRRFQSNGNYDALLGKVVNFNWTFNKDGTYDINVILKSMGDVVESLKANILLPLSINLTPATEQKEIADKKKESLSQAAASSAQLPSDATQVSTANLALFKQLSNNPEYKKQSEAVIKITQTKTQPTLIDDDGTFETTLTVEEEQRLKDAGKLNLYSNKNANSLFKYLYKISIRFNTKYMTDTGLSVLNSTNGYIDYINQKYDGVPPQFYIRFGCLLDWIETNAIPNIDNSDQKLIKFDTDVNTNIIILANSQRPTNPLVCGASYSQEFSSGGIVKFLGGGGSNDKVSGEPFEERVNDSRYGKIMNLYFNFNHIISLVKENTTDGDLLVIDFVKSLCDSWNKTSGNFSRLYPSFDEERNQVIIADENALPDRDAWLKRPAFGNTSTKTTIFDIYGYSNANTSPSSSAGFITDFTFQTSISSNLANMITIGAQKNGYIVGEDATGISRMNNGFKDRIKPTITSPGVSVEDSNKSKEKSLEEEYSVNLENFGEYLANLGSSLNKPIPKINVETIESFTSCIGKLIKYEQSNLVLSKNQSEIEKNKKEGGAIDSFPNNFASSSTGFLPFNLSLTMEGLSGIKIYQKFLCDTKFLPSNYPKSLEFLISGITNTIVGNKWETKIESLAIPKNPYSPSTTVPVVSTKTIVAQCDETLWTQRTVTSKFPLNPQGNGGVIDNVKSQIVLHYTAGNQLRDKGKATVAYLNGINRTNKKTGVTKYCAGLSYHFLIDASGQIEQMLPLNFYAYHATSSNRTAIGISLQNLGFGPNESTSSALKGNTIPDNQLKNVRMVGPDGTTNKSYRGNNWSQDITDGQLTALKKLYNGLLTNPTQYKGGEKVNIDFQAGYDFSKLYNQLFPPTSTQTWNNSNSNNLSGLYTHGSVSGKVDMSPIPKIVNFFKELNNTTIKSYRYPKDKFIEITYLDLGSSIQGTLNYTDEELIKINRKPITFIIKEPFFSLKPSERPLKVKTTEISLKAKLMKQLIDYIKIL